MSDDLEPLSPREGMELYLDHREPDLSKKSIENHRYRLRSFVSFCEEEGIENLNTVTGRDLHKFRVWRRNGDGERYSEVSKMTLYGNLQTLRKFLEFCASIDAVEPGMRERVLIPETEDEEETKNVYLDEDRALDILDHLERFQYASRDHVMLSLLWHTGMRLGSLRALDVEDFDADAQCLDLVHRPESGTPLKNKDAAERSIAVGEYHVEMIEAYIQNNRHEVTDDHGRRPLITSAQGRLTESPIRRIVYKWTLPCQIGDCPHDKDPKTCEWVLKDHRASCPSSRSPHGIRRGSITRHLREGTPRDVVSDRMNVTQEVLDRHYDETTDRERMELRREFIKDA